MTNPRAACLSTRHSNSVATVTLKGSPSELTLKIMISTERDRRFLHGFNLSWEGGGDPFFLIILYTITQNIDSKHLRKLALFKF